MPLDDFDPLFGEAPDEVSLKNAPLASVIAQVQFAPILLLRSEAYVATFQERIRADYPKFEQSRVQVLTPPGVTAEIPDEVFWRFTCAKGEWRVSLSSTFVTLDTRAYTSRADFAVRLKSLIVALKATVGSASVMRIGVRYIDHVKSPEVDNMADMLRVEMLGVGNTALRAHLLHSITEMYCNVREGNLLARWGLLPPHGTHEPNLMPPVAGRSWFLDIDIFKQRLEPSEEMDPDSVHSEVFALATRSYAFFRWATTDRFLDVYGATKCSQ